MPYTVCLLTAAWIAAQPGSNLPLGPKTSTDTVIIQKSAPPAADSPPAGSVRLVDRLRNLFRASDTKPKSVPAYPSQQTQAPTVWTTRTPSQPPAPGSVKTPAPTPAPALLKVQQAPAATGPTSAIPVTVAPAAAVPVTASPVTASQATQAPPLAGDVPMNPGNGPRPPIELSAKDLERVGHEQDYSWITGRLFRVPGEAGRWGIRYAGTEEVDRYGGSLVLSQTSDMGRYHQGDLVCIHGKVSSSARNLRQASAVYEVKEINVIEQSGR